MRTYSGHFSKRKKQIGSAEKTAKLKPEEFGVVTLKARFITAIFETEYFLSKVKCKKPLNFQPIFNRPFFE